MLDYIRSELARRGFSVECTCECGLCCFAIRKNGIFACSTLDMSQINSAPYIEHFIHHICDVWDSQYKRMFGRSLCEEDHVWHSPFMFSLDLAKDTASSIDITTPKLAVDLRNHIDKVIFNDPATIVLWKDGSKTVTICGECDIYDPEKGLAMCFAKKLLGDEGNYYNTFKKWLPKEEVSEEPSIFDILRGVING